MRLLGAGATRHVGCGGMAHCREPWMWHRAAARRIMRAVLVSGQWALVTGASSGIGEQLSRQLAARGISLVLTARGKDRLEALAAELGSAHGIGTRVVAADLSTASGVDEALARIAALELPIDHLIGNAGFGMNGDFADGDPAEQRRMIVLNCEAIVALTRALLPGMIERGRGGVMHVSSTAAFQPAATFAEYAATKTFVLHFTEGLHEELRGTGVHAMVFCPGPVHTNFQERAHFRIAKIQEPMTMSAADTARHAIEDYERGCVVSIPGALNRVGTVLASAAPRSLVRRVAGALMKSGVRRVE
jgi:short-subunit dehydrogenase